jgi:putative addiction module CopG family antidote
MSQVATIRVTLPPALNRYVREKVAAGRFDSPADVIRQSLREMEAQERDKLAYWDEINSKIAQAETAVKRGQTMDGPSFMRKMKRKLLAEKTRQSKRK